MFNIYGKPNCKSCIDTKKLLLDRGVSFTYLSLGSDYDYDKILEINPNHKSMPMVTDVVDGVEKYIGTLQDLKEYLFRP